MSLTVSAESGNNQRSLVPAGQQLAYCYGVVDMGTHHDEWKGKARIRKKVLFLFEFPEHKVVFREEDGAQPLGRSKQYTANLSEKSNLRADLEDWRERPFTQNELAKFDLKNVVGKPCLITIFHKPNDTGDMRDSIKRLAKVSANVQMPDPVNEPYAYEIESHPKNWDRLPNWVKEEIKGSVEFKEMASGEKPQVPNTATEEELHEPLF